MKKVILSLAAAAILASCAGGNKANSTETESDSIQSFQQTMITENVMAHLDSIATQISQLERLTFIHKLALGEISLSEEQQLVKPEYLLDLTTLDDLTTLKQQYSALGMLWMDKVVAKAYSYKADEYDAALEKLVAKVSDPALEGFFSDIQSETDYADVIQNFYNAEKENGRVNFFWAGITANLVEDFYILTQQDESIIAENIDDKAAENTTLHLMLAILSLEDLKEYDPEISELCEAIQPLKKLDALTTEQLIQQLKDMQGEIAAVRSFLLQ